MDTLGSSKSVLIIKVRHKVSFKTGQAQLGVCMDQPGMHAGAMFSVSVMI